MKTRIFRFPGDEKEKKENFPGYPHYPASEDITQPGNAKRVNMEEEENSNRPAEEEDPDDEIGIVPGTEADVTEEDLEILGPKEEDMDMDMGDDELIPRISREEDDLDIPGTELDDVNENLGEEDEENNYYSLGGDRQNSEDPQ